MLDSRIPGKATTFVDAKTTPDLLRPSAASRAAMAQRATAS